jgi:putative tryptophan/tyrosine transport system substrate-binding protein
VIRREFIALLGGAAASWPLAAWAQQKERVWRVAHVMPSGRSIINQHYANRFEQRLLELGYVIGRDIVLTSRVTEPKEAEHAIAELLPETDLLVIWTTYGSLIAKKLAPTIPIVFLAVAAPVEVGLITSLAHPEGHITGVTAEATSETYAKRLQTLAEIVPNLSRVAVLRTVGDAHVAVAMAALTQAAPDLSVKLLPFEIRLTDDLEQAFAAMMNIGPQALIVIGTAVTYAAGARIAELALVHHLPACYPFRDTVAAGGLVSLSPDFDEIVRRGADYVSKIVKGAKPSELPVEQPTRYALHINLKTAKALELEVPPTVLARADEVIE